MRTILITGGNGFIGSNLIKYWLFHHPEEQVVNLDCNTYAARPEYLTPIVTRKSIQERYHHELVDIRDHLAVARVMNKWKPHGVIHLAAESHVCRSIAGPKDFVMTNIVGTFHLLEEFRQLDNGGRFLHVSTDEVFGELGPEDPPFYESTPLRPRSPYAASKAGSDMLVKSWVDTYLLNACLTNCSNNFGPNQHEEKLIPRTIQKILQGEPMTIYGRGDQVRDWLFVNDHCRALDLVYHLGQVGHRYCVGGEMELTNLEMIEKVYTTLMGVSGEDYALKLIYTQDRPTDDHRYAIDTRKLRELGWSIRAQEFDFKLKETVEWYWKKWNHSAAW